MKRFTNLSKQTICTFKYSDTDLNPVQADNKFLVDMVDRIKDSIESIGFDFEESCGTTLRYVADRNLYQLWFTIETDSEFGFLEAIEIQVRMNSKHPDWNEDRERLYCGLFPLKDFTFSQIMSELRFVLDTVNLNCRKK